MDENYIENDGWEVIKSGRFLVRENTIHVNRVLQAKRIYTNRMLAAELASYADEVRRAD